MKKNQPAMKVILLLLFLLPTLLFSAIQTNRPYEPVVMRLSKIPVLKTFENAPVNDLYIYAYGAATDSWTLIPFQIDEITKGVDPLSPGKTDREFYFIPEEWEIDAHDGLLTPEDEIVFMVKDAGDKAPSDKWIDNTESEQYDRVEIQLSDPLENDNKAYVYIYRSSSIADAIPHPYEFSYDQTEDRISTTNYTVGFNEYGVIDDIILKTNPSGNLDIFDTQKLRFGGIINIFIPVEATLSEEVLYLFDEIEITQDPVVRMIRVVKQTLNMFDIVFDEFAFRFTTKFYPYSGNIETGASISGDDLEQQFPDAEISILLKSSRQSWDFNENAVGMNFYNTYNQNIPIDGTPDNMNLTVDVPISEWALTSGNPGSMLTYVALAEEKWDNVSLYYHDNQEGGEADSDHFTNSTETADNKSYGDHGILLLNSSGKEEIDLDLDLTAYFLPVQNLSQADGAKLAEQIESPVEINKSSSPVLEDQYSTKKNSFQIHPNYPNPFNPTTLLSFSLDKNAPLTLSIADINGRTIKKLANGQYIAGTHQLLWDGTNDVGTSMTSGVYFFMLSSGENHLTQKLLLVK